MSGGLLLDTHIAVWLDGGSARLRPETRRLIDECWKQGGTIYLSAVTAWEMALLVDTGRIELDVPVGEWVARFVDRPGVEGRALSLSAAALSYRLPGFENRDPGDRLLVATAMELGVPLVTYDERILAFAAKDGVALVVVG